MSDDSQQQERTEEPTPRRLEKARAEGKVARSRELTTFVMLFAGILSLTSLSGALFTALGEVMTEAFSFEQQYLVEPREMLILLALLGERSLSALLPLFLIMVLVAALAPMLIGGFLMSATSLKPKWSKIDPIKGFGRIFSAQAIAELAKVLAKVALLSSVVAMFLLSRVDDFLALLTLPAMAAISTGLYLAALVCGLMILTLILVSLIDVPFQLWSHTKQLRMTREEIRRELKDSDGDPQLKARIRAQQQEMARRRMMDNVATADVVITNPTHFAVALSYAQANEGAPRVVAKGAERVALRIRELAKEHKVPLLEAPALARSLYRHVDLDQEIPYELYTAVAEVMAWALNLKRLPDHMQGVVPEPAALAIPASHRVE
ncbi:flagellar biosynthesis protein FlhB [Halioglobus japonicus]|uniref:Flagellar biosynthetic protein FlhB n=1 Tax=Halioglobus japonicus TaxID=930805 RepID=A0AAP8SN52_9GAMM|nr:flagellar biosynthesis protein FlhB [Halioglobus japonicus]AQA18121.1 flagellar biosynthesis protein FlhB [Halioglobus japonicus]PLW86116.1 flagellar biosynthesis protein FlhB [Halioglobus japonicus]GHD14391.1 flagellar biosynthesis protein FlhB [Halioglobus japonicus]